MRLAVFLAFLLPGVVHAEALARHALSAADYEKWLEGLAKDNQRPVQVGAHSVNGKPAFTAVAAPNPARLAWFARHGLSEDEFSRLFNGKETRGHRLTTACAYLEGKNVRYLGVWVKDAQPVDSAARIGLPAKAVAAAIADARKQGQRPAAITAVGTAKGARYLVELIGDDGAPSVTRFGVSRSEYQKVLADHRAKKYRPAWASAFDDGGTTRYNVVLVQDASRPWEARHDLTEADYRKTSEAMAKRGLRLASATAYRSGRATLYLAVWLGELTLPASGKEVPALAVFDDTMRRYMREHDIHCGALAVVRGNKLVLSRGYGYSRRDGSRQVAADDPFRLASVTKPITAAAVHALVEAGKLTFDQSAFELLGTKPPAGKKADDRLKAITVRHLLDHKGGWDGSAGPVSDILFAPERVTKGLKKSLPLTADDFVRYMAGQPLQFAPGSKRAYANIGYITLGRVIEKASGMTYEQYVQKALAKPLGIKSLRVGHSLPAKRQANEPYYRDPSAGLNLQTGKGMVPFPDGGYLLEALDAAGGLVASAPDVARFYDEYLMDGRPRQGGQSMGTSFGSLPGTFTMVKQHLDGTVVVALFNQRHNPDGRQPFRIEGLMDEAVKAVKKWP